MDLSPYVETVRHGVASAAALGDDHTRQTAERLGGAVEASTRLALIRALSDAAAQISAETAPTSVELRMNGPDPELVVLVPAPSPEPTLLLPEELTPYAGGSDPDAALSDAASSVGDTGGSEDDEPVARISLRLPSSVKTKVDEKADRDGISTNAWLLRAVMVALDDRPTPPPPPAPRPGPPSESGPFGPYGVFGPNGPFGAAGVFGARGRRPGEGLGVEPARRGTVQGWVR